MPELPTARRVANRLTSGAVVAATLLVLGQASVRGAAVVGGLAAALWVAADVAETAVGDYAGNGVLGLSALAFVGYVAGSAPVVGVAPVAVPSALVGGWLLVDAVQHRRHGVDRDDRVTVRPVRSDGGVVRGVVAALLSRLLEPFVLGREIVASENEDRVDDGEADDRDTTGGDGRQG